jgi:hypothetical protein
VRLSFMESPPTKLSPQATAIEDCTRGHDIAPNYAAATTRRHPEPATAGEGSLFDVSRT